MRQDVDDLKRPSDDLKPGEDAIVAGHAAWELHHGRIDHLAYHILQSDFQIHPVVARKILALIDGSEPKLLFEMKLVRRSDLPPAYKDPHSIEARNFDMAIEVARRGGFARGRGKRVCHEVGKLYSLSGLFVSRCVKPYRERAFSVLEEERAQEAYGRGEVDFLGRPISSHSGFVESEE